MIILPRFDSPRYVVRIQQASQLDKSIYYAVFDLHTNEFVLTYDSTEDEYIQCLSPEKNKVQQWCNDLDTDDALYTVAIIEYTTGEEYSPPFNQFQ